MGTGAHPRPETDREHFAALLASGASMTEAAAVVGICRNTASAWRQSPEVLDALDTHRREVRAAVSHRLTAVAESALERAESLLADPETPPSVVVRLLAVVLAESRLRADVDDVLARLDRLESGRTEPTRPREELLRVLDLEVTE